MQRWLQNQRILTVGDGDFTFSISLLQHKPKDLCATCFDTEAVVCSKYSSARSSIDTLRNSPDCVCFTGIDATKLPADITRRQFDRVIFQFPLVPPVGKEEWHARANDGETDVVALLNREMLLRFLRQVEPILALEGLVMITSKDVHPYQNWRLERTLSPYTRKIRYLGKLPFDEDAFPGYQFQNVERDQKVKSTESYTYLFGSNTPDDIALVPPDLPRGNEKLYCDICLAGPFSGDKDQDSHATSTRHLANLAFETKWALIGTRSYDAGG